MPYIITCERTSNEAFRSARDVHNVLAHLMCSEATISAFVSLT